MSVGLYEQALQLCSLCRSTDKSRKGLGGGLLLKGVDVNRLHELHATSLWLKGDFDKSVGHFLKAGTPLWRLLRLIPEIVPPTLAPVLEAIETAHPHQADEDRLVSFAIFLSAYL